MTVHDRPVWKRLINGVCGTEAQTSDYGVSYCGFLLGVQGTSAYQVHLVVGRDVWDIFRQRRQVLTCTLR